MPIDRTPGSKCAICGRLASDAHHYVFRSRGGTDDQTMPLCHDCHMDIHNERLRIDVDLLVTTAWLRVYSVEPWAVVVDRAYTPGEEQADLLGTVEQLESIRLGAWPVQAEAVYRLYSGWLMRDEQGRVEHRKSRKLLAIAKAGHMKPGTARQQYDVAKAFWPLEEGATFSEMVKASPVQHFAVWRKAASQPDPYEAIQKAEDVAGSIENASAEMLVAAIEERKPKTLYVRTPQDPALLGQWVPFSELEHERR
jgi:hypothetical protein